MGIITKSLLKFARSPKRVYSLIRKIAPQVIDFTLVDDENIAKDAIEKELLLSAFVLAYDPNKDMRSNFILDYTKEIEENFLSYNSSEDILDYCVSSGCGVCFDSKNVDNEAKETLHDYIITRLVLYRRIITELHNGNNKRFDCLYYAIYHCSFSVYWFSKDEDIDFLKNDIIYSNHNKGDVYIRYEGLLQILDKTYYNIIKVPKATWLTDFPESESLNTEGVLPHLKLKPGDLYLSFGKITGAGILSCRDCGYSVEIVAFLHDFSDATIGRQCPQCGSFCTEDNHSEEYHSFGPSTDDVVCPKCGYIIRNKEESIFKGNSNPLFCPKCYGINLLYHIRIVT